MAPSKYVGVDGCPYGWFSVAFDDGGKSELRVCRTFDQLLVNYNGAKLILVDMPIGLPKDKPGRDCDGKARSYLEGTFSSSVFPTPTRDTIEQVGRRPDVCLCATNIQYLFSKSEIKGINLQTFAIAHKIAEVDEVMKGRGSDATPKVREVHPEVCFRALNKGESLKFGKKYKEEKGLNERLCILKGIEGRSQAIFDEACCKFSRKVVAKDDILDALAAAVTAYKGCTQGPLQTLPGTPQTDCRGLPMEMVYWKPG